MAKKNAKWFGINMVDSDFKIMEVSVVEDTATRIYLAKAEAEKRDLKGRSWLEKYGTYERWYKTRAEAVSAKLARLAETVAARKQRSSDAERCLSAFRKLEGLK